MPPKQRPGRTPTGTDDSGKTLAAVLGAGLVVALALLGLWLLGRDDTTASPEARGEARAALEAAGCTLVVRDAPENKSDHSDVASPDERHPAWNTDPPTSGPHYGQTLIYGAYEEPVEQARVIHNLEHGAVFIQYGSEVPVETVTALRAFYDKNRAGTILAPYPSLGARIALGAWNDDGEGRGQGVLATCPDFDDAAYQAFLRAHQFQGPERFSPEAMQPGSG